MIEKFEYKGYWWLPSNPNAVVAGILTYIPHKNIILELIGNFDSEKNPLEAFLGKESKKIIHGFTSDSKEITLVNCHPSGSLNFSCSFPIIRYSCQFIVIGKHLDSFTQKCFYKAFATIPELTYWKPPKSLKTTVQFNKENSTEFTSISFETEGKIISNNKIDDNTQLIIKEGVNYYRDHFSSKIEQQTYLEILKQNDESIGDFYSNINLFEQFLSLAALQTVKCSKISLYDRTIFQELRDGEKLYDPIEIIYIQQEDTSTSTRTNSHDFLFDYESIALQYAQVIQRWYAEKYDIAPIRRHLIDSTKNKRIFSSVDFLIVIQAIEGFWWRFRENDYRENKQIPPKKKTPLEVIINELVTEFDSINKIRNLNLDIKSVRDSRHYYSHFMNKAEKTHALDGRELFDLTFKLRKILICCVLEFIGFKYAEINHILNHSNNRLLEG